MMKNFTLFVLISSTTLTPLTYAAQKAQAMDAETQNLIQHSDDTTLMIPAELPSVQAQASAVAKPHDAPLLPFWGEAARAKGYDLPETYGIGVNYMNMRQNIDVDSINFSGLKLGSMPVGPNMFKIDVGHTRERSKTETMRLDAWILPFMNIYGIVGHTKGSSLSHVNVAAMGVSPPSLQNLDFKLKFKGTTYGAGTTFAGGYQNWFGTLDMNYTQTRFDILDGSIDAFTLTPRIGYRFTTPSAEWLHMPQGKLNVWIGSMYQDVQQEFKGKISDLNMPVQLQPLINMVNKQGQGRFDVKQHLQSPWNVLLGAQYEITRNVNVTTEFGFADRNSFMTAAEYRF